jgi:hypothetical protein
LLITDEFERWRPQHDESSASRMLINFGGDLSAIIDRFQTVVGNALPVPRIEC